MARLNQDTDATLVHGITGQDVQLDILLAGTEYTHEGRAADRVNWDGSTTEQALILVHFPQSKGAYRYRVDADQVSPDPVAEDGWAGLEAAKATERAEAAAVGKYDDTHCPVCGERTYDDDGNPLNVQHCQ